MNSSSNVILEVEKLVKNFGDYKAIRGVSFNVREGEIVGFLGPNGVGKSTTINCLLGIIKPDSGQIKIFGKDLQKKRTEIMQNINYCSAEYNLFWSLTVFESLLVFAKYYQVPNAKSRIDEVLELFDMLHLRDKQIRSLSFGQRARATFCKALLNKPKLLLLDEPMSSMDPDVVDKGINLLLKIQKESGMSILYTSHNMWEIEQVANRVVFINHGKVIAQGSPLELTQQEVKLEAKEPNLREVFIKLSRRKKVEVVDELD